MKILKLLNKKFLTYFLFLTLISSHSNPNEPVDIWNIDQNKIQKTQSKNKFHNQRCEFRGSQVQTYTKIY